MPGDGVPVIREQRRQVVLRPQPTNAIPILPRPPGILALQIVQGGPGVAIEIAQRRVLALQQGNHATQDGMFEDVGVVAGVKTVAEVQRGYLWSGKIESQSRLCWLMDTNKRVDGRAGD